MGGLHESTEVATTCGEMESGAFQVYPAGELVPEPGDHPAKEGTSEPPSHIYAGSG